MKKGCKYVTYSLLFILMFCVGIAFHSSLLSELSSKTLQNSLDAIYGNKYKWILNNTYGYRKDVVENARIYSKYKNDIQVLKKNRTTGRNRIYKLSCSNRYLLRRYTV